MLKVNNKDANGVVLVPLLLTLNIFHTLFWHGTKFHGSSDSIANFEHVNADWNWVTINMK